jgi:hypothetical protein
MPNLSLYINRGRAAGIRHQVFSKIIASLLYPCLGGVTWSLALLRQQESGLSQFFVYYQLSSNV